MAIFGITDSQTTLTENCDITVQNNITSPAIQIDMGQSPIRPARKPIPDHIGKSIKITQGFKVSVLGPNSMPYNGKLNGFYRHGFTLDQKEWLDINVGNTVSNHLWEEGQGDWIFHGSRWSKSSLGAPFFDDGKLYLDFSFRDKRKALLFKLTW